MFVVIEEYPRSQRSGFNEQAFRIARLNLDETFPRPGARVIVGGERRIVNPLCARLDQTPIVWIELAFESLDELLAFISQFLKGRFEALLNGLDQVLVGEKRFQRRRILGAQPTAKSVPRWIQPGYSLEETIDRTVVTVFELLEILAHVIR